MSNLDWKSVAVSVVSSLLVLTLGYIFVAGKYVQQLETASSKVDSVYLKVETMDKRVSSNEIAVSKIDKMADTISNIDKNVSGMTISMEWVQRDVRRLQDLVDKMPGKGLDGFKE